MAARLVTSHDVDKREGVLTKMVLGIPMSANQDVVRNVYGLHYTSLGEDIAYAGARLRKNTITLHDVVTEKDNEHELYDSLLLMEDQYKEDNPEAHALWKAMQAEKKKNFNRARAKVELVPMA